MALIIKQPYPHFAAINGAPLDGGYVYFGAVNDDPQSSPVSVYWDEAMTDPAAQPLRTSMGKFVRAGQVANVWAAGNYSLKILDARGALVAYFPDSSDYDNSGDATALVNALKADIASASDTAKGDALIGVKYGSGKARTQHDKNRDSVTTRDFDIKFDGSDETVEFSKFWQSAIDNPGVPHYWLDSGTVCISSELPTINKSGVWIEAINRSDIHDTGTLTTGATVKWIGANAQPYMLRVQSPSGAGLQRVAGVTLTGIAFDCQSKVQKGVDIASVEDSTFELDVANATVYGLGLGVVATLGEARDLQRCDIKYNGRQIESTTGYSLYIYGLPGVFANVSMNRLHVDIQHSNAPAVAIANSDNNRWQFFRAYRTVSGTATESASLLGGPVDSERCRHEIFEFVTTNLPIRAYGGNLYSFAATGIRIDLLDTENGTPDPIIDNLASVYYARGSSPFGDTPWKQYTVDVAADAGAIGTTTASGRYLKRGRIMHLRIECSITGAGTATGALKLGLPQLVDSGVTPSGALFYGQLRNNGKGLAGFADGGDGWVRVLGVDGVTIITAGSVVSIQGEIPIG